MTSLNSIKCFEFLGVISLICDSEDVLRRLRSLVAGRPYEMGIATRMMVRSRIDQVPPTPPGDCGNLLSRSIISQSDC